MKFIYDPSLVLYLPLHELDGTAFASKDTLGHLCTVTGAVWDSQGRTFDGADDRINCGQFSFALPFSVEGWIKRGRVNTAEVILSRIAIVTTYQGFWWLFDSATDQIYPTYGNGTTVFNSKIGAGISDTTTFHHIVSVHQQTRVDLYIDGGLSESRTGLNVNFSLPANNMLIGERSDNGGNDFQGTIPEVRIYNRALTPTEVLRNYLATKWRYR